MKILLTGAAGYIGSIVRGYLTKKNYTIIGVDIVKRPGIVDFSCDLADVDAVKQIAESVTPDIIIHTAGNKDIKYCEENPTAAYRSNCDATKNLANIFGSKARIIYLSTDYVFNGLQGGYREFDPTSPQTIYGKSKLCGEEGGRIIAGNNFITIRLSALYDAQATFLRFIKDKLTQGQTVDCYSDVYYSPTYYLDFLNALEFIIKNTSSSSQIYHICGEATTRYMFARIYAEVFGFESTLIKESSANGSGKFLFPNLSLNCEWSLEQLKIKTTKIRESLIEIQKDK